MTTDTTTHTVITGLADGSAAGEGDGPTISVLERRNGATVIRLAFRAGQVMADHQAGKPILIVGQSGDIDLTVDGERIGLTAGTAVHVEPRITHSLTAVGDATATLLVLEPTK